MRNWSCFLPLNWTLAEDRCSAMMTVLDKPQTDRKEMTMGLLIAVAIAVVVLIVFDTLALRAGTDSRPGFGDDREQEPRARFLYPRFM